MNNNALGDLSHERYIQSTLRLANDFQHQKIITVGQAQIRYVKNQGTIIKWAKAQNVPLIIDNQHTVVPWTDATKPRNLPQGATVGDGWQAYLTANS